MKVRMLITMSGPRHDGRMWPPAGEILDNVPDWEHKSLTESGWAEDAEPKKKPKVSEGE